MQHSCILRKGVASCRRAIFSNTLRRLLCLKKLFTGIKELKRIFDNFRYLCFIYLRGKFSNPFYLLQQMYL